jgi:hypothetical protein
MKFRTEIFPGKMFSKISYSDRILSLGSCFSVEIAQKLNNLNYQVLINPSGITFNPISICNTIMSLFNADSLPEESLIYNGNVWCHPDFHGAFNHPDKSETLRMINQSMEEARNFCKEITHVIITMGTAFVYESKENGRIVNNCHKIPQSSFNKRLLLKSEIVEQMTEAMKVLNANSSTALKFIFTLSPIRHIKEGLHENQISKAQCLLAINDLVNANESCAYFPSYEIVLDDLRDYRFYKTDMLHPNDQAIDYIFKKFEDYALAPEENDLRKRFDKLNAAINHRAMNPDSEKHKRFLVNLEKEKEAIQKEYPHIEIQTK